MRLKRERSECELWGPNVRGASGFAKPLPSEEVEGGADSSKSWSISWAFSHKARHGDGVGLVFTFLEYKHFCSSDKGSSIED